MEEEDPHSSVSTEMFLDMCDDEYSFFTNNNSLEDYLIQYNLTYIPNPSDDSDFEDTTYELDQLIARAIRDRKRTDKFEKECLEKGRESRAKEYFETHIDDADSIFNFRGIHFRKYTHKIIRFTYSASELSRRFMCENRVFHVTLKYNSEYKFWALTRFHVPNREDVLKIFKKYRLDDDCLINGLFKIAQVIESSTMELINIRKAKYQAFLNDEEVELNSDDEKLFLSEEERRIRKRKVNEIWQRMLPPQPSDNRFSTGKRNSKRGRKE